jgi:hypothetical protein
MFSRLLLVAAVALVMCGTTHVRAEELALPGQAELSTFSPQAIRFYGLGYRALDRVDYVNAYANLSKAAQLQPNAVRLNLITGALAMKYGRSKPAAEARAYYDMAINCYRNILRQPGLEDSMIREVENRLRIAMEENDTLVQRDNKREATGNIFVVALNREIVKETPARTPSATPAATPPPGGLPPTPVVAQAGYGAAGAYGGYPAGMNPYGQAGVSNPYAAMNGAPAMGMPTDAMVPGAFPPGGEVPGGFPPGGAAPGAFPPGVPPGQDVTGTQPPLI